MYATEAQARRKAKRVPILGRFIAAVEIPEAGPIRYERTLPSHGHYTVWGDPQVMLNQVTSVVEADGP